MMLSLEHELGTPGDLSPDKVRLLHSSQMIKSFHFSIMQGLIFAHESKNETHEIKSH
jgi:hypothetical protein